MTILVRREVNSVIYLGHWVCRNGSTRPVFHCTEIIRASTTTHETEERRAADDALIHAAEEKQHQRHRPARALVLAIVNRAVRDTEITVADIMSKNRKAPIVRARHDVFMALRALGYSLPGIGAAMGGKDHTTVLNGARRAKARMAAQVAVMMMPESPPQ